MPSIFPFTAIVNQDRMRRALVLNAVHPQIGGVLIRGERGTAKSTAARALAALLPEISVITECSFSCDPDQPVSWCTQCQERVINGEAVPHVTCRTRFVDLPVSATEDRVVGTLDIERAIQKGERHFEPGVLAAANRGILYVDEVNLLDDHVVDILLDAAAMGVNVVEREGISFSHPARFILIGTMNPEEGDLRPQLLDRFALCVDIQGVRDATARRLIIERNLAFESDPEGFYLEWLPREETLSDQIFQARQLLPHVHHTQGDLMTIATMMAELGVDGHRADLVILKTARAHAAFEGRTRITDRDILLAAELALPHRLKRHPLDPQQEITVEDLSRRLEEAREKAPEEDMTTLEQEEGDDGQKKTQLTVETEDGQDDGEDKTEAPHDPMLQEIPKWPTEGRWWWDGGDETNVGEPFAPQPFDTPLDRLARGGAGRRRRTRTEQSRGRYVRARFSPDNPRDLAFDATFRAAAPHQTRRRRSDGPALSIKPQDYYRKVRMRPAANLVLFVVDASWSMAVAERMEATKGAVLSLLTDVYQRRDRVGLVVFQKNAARLILPPTNSVELAQKALADIPVGGKTPLSAGLKMAYDVITREVRQHADVIPLMVLLTDGAGNVSLGNMAPQEEAHRLAVVINAAHIRSVVINMENAAFDQGYAQALADHLSAPCYTLDELRAEALLATVRGELQETGV
ncbi:MAG: putative cobaltochelatase [Anaerolineae bacterium]|nr:putative cobaltochelatase [Anaerolineae bacterium]